MNALEHSTVILPAGGRGERLSSLTGSGQLNKVAVRVGRLSLIERTVLMWSRAGVRRFVVLVYHRRSSVRDILGEGRRFGATVSYSADPGRPVGRGGAILLAIRRGLVPLDGPIIVHNPDDQIVGIERRFARTVMNQHLRAVRRGALATAVCVPWTEYAYTSFEVRNGMARSARMYPRVPFPAHIGLTVFEPGVVRLFRRLIDLRKKVDFERVIFPALARQRRLGIAMIPAGTWIPVNDLKGYRKLAEAV